MTHEQNIIKGLDDAAMARVYNRKRKATIAAATFTERLALVLAKLTGLLYFGFLCFCVGYFSTLYFDGLLFEVPGLVSYWVDFGRSQ